MSTMNIIAASLVVASLAAITVTTNAYAQSQQGQGRGPCPEGFEMNRGVCQAEPEYSCQFLLDQGFPPGRIQLTDDNQCQIRHGYGPDCGTAQDSIGYDIFDDRCETAGEFVDLPLPESLWCRGDDTVQRVDNVWQCVFYEYQPAEPECSTGVLNEATEMCEVKPGNRGGNNRV